MPTTIDKIHEQAKKEEEEMQRRIAHQPMMGQPRGDGRERWGMNDWLSGELSNRTTPPTKILAERFSKVMASMTAGVSWCGKVVLLIILPSCVCLLNSDKNKSQ